MSDDKRQGITVKRDKDFSEWYAQVVLRSELADYSAVKGCMVIRPLGYGIWENLQSYFNGRMKALGVSNSYFPLFIPESFFKREAEHAEGFSPEVAWIANREEERLAVRPTSETVIYDSYSRWIRSWRDLPLRINQWCNVVRWETKAVKLFVRSREFLWQEGHCVYATEAEADKEAVVMLGEYETLCRDLLAVPVVLGRKTEKEKFAGAKTTYTVEGLMPDGKALQLGTSHALGQGFARAFNISFLDKDKARKTPWQNSWGFSTRLIGAVVMAHGDDKGLVLPPRIAPLQVVVVPILFEDSKAKVLKKAAEVKKKLAGFSVYLDDRDSYSPGWKFNEWELKGVPLRIEIGPKDLAKNQVVVVRRDTGAKEAVNVGSVEKRVKALLEDIQASLLSRAEKSLKQNLVNAASMPELIKNINAGKMALVPFCGNAGCEDVIREKTSASSRCIPFEQPKTVGKCIGCGKKAEFMVYFARAY